MDAPTRSVEKPITFSLATVFFVFAVLCVLLAQYQAWGVQAVGGWSFTLLLMGAYVLHRLRVWAARNLALGTFLLTGIYAMLPSLGIPRHYAQEIECRERLKVLGRAMFEYEWRHNAFPQHGTGGNGGAGLSWRVSLLPFLNQSATHKKFRLQQDWDSAANRPLADLTIPEFRCPSEINNRKNETSYVAITGDDTCWPTTSITTSHIKDGASNTILFAETHDSGILWPEPRDMEYDKLDWRINGTPGNSVSSSHGPVIRYFDGSRKLKNRTGVNVAMADGSVRRLTADVDPELLRQMVNRRDGGPSWEEMP